MKKAAWFFPKPRKFITAWFDKNVLLRLVVGPLLAKIVHCKAPYPELKTWWKIHRVEKININVSVWIGEDRFSPYSPRGRAFVENICKQT